MPNSSRTAISSSLTICWMRAREDEDFEIVGDLGADRVQLVGDLVAAERGQPLQAQLEDRARLLFGQVVGAVLVDAVARIVDQQDQRLDVGRRPAPLHQLLARRLRVGRMADEPDHLVDVGDRDGEADQDVGAARAPFSAGTWCAG
ncbi:MAG: hypothetical protein NVV73_03255 [Cellvibrionaceae bacterium]|nr:hypothetical protein [Cellvibrionaceae bacterium]